jgi:hypothetical protein
LCAREVRGDGDEHAHYGEERRFVIDELGEVELFTVIIVRLSVCSAHTSLN